MAERDDSRRVHFRSPEYLVDRLDAIAELFGTDRTDILVEAIREYVEETAKNESFQKRVATKYYEGELEFETVKQLVGAESAQRLRLLKADLEGEAFDIADPDDVDVYDGEVRVADPKESIRVSERVKRELDHRRRDGESNNDVLDRILEEGIETGDFDDGFGRWSDDEADRARENRRQSTEKRKERMKYRADDGP